MLLFTATNLLRLSGGGASDSLSESNRGFRELYAFRSACETIVLNFR